MGVEPHDLETDSSLHSPRHPLSTSCRPSPRLPRERFSPDVDSSRQLRANTGRSPMTRGTPGVDLELPFEIAQVNGREARESGLRLKASVAPGIVLLLSTESRTLPLQGRSDRGSAPRRTPAKERSGRGQGTSRLSHLTRILCLAKARYGGCRIFV